MYSIPTISMTIMKADMSIPSVATPQRKRNMRYDQYVVMATPIMEVVAETKILKMRAWRRPYLSEAKPNKIPPIIRPRK